MNNLEQAAQAHNDGQELAKTNNKGQAMQARDTGINSILYDAVKFDQVWRVAKMYASTALVPVHFQNHPNDVFVAITLADRLGVDPFMLMQNLYLVYGRPGMSGKFQIAMCNKRGPFKGSIQWVFDGEGTKRSCTAFAERSDTGERCEMTISWATVVAEKWDQPKKNKKTGGMIPSKWNTMRDQMFRYRTASWLISAYCPEVIFGIPGADELEDAGPEVNIIQATIEKDQDVPTFDDPMPDPPDAEKTSEPVNGEIVDNDPLGLDEPHPNQAGHDRLVERIGAMGASDDQIRTWSRLSGIDTGNPETMINANLDKLWALHVEAKQAAEQADAKPAGREYTHDEQSLDGKPTPSKQTQTTGTGWSLPELMADMAALEIPTDWQANWMTETGIMQGDKRTHSQPRLEQLAVLIEDYRKNA